MRTKTECVAVLSLCLSLILGVPTTSLAEITAPTSAKQGETIEITLQGDEGVQMGAQGEPKVLFNGRSYPLYPGKSAEGKVFWHGLLAVPADLNPGTYNLKIGEKEIPLKVGDAKFPLQRISLPQAKDNFVMSPGEKEAIEAAKAVLSPERLWYGKFAVPCDARQSARFGMKRMVNGRLLKDYFHTGLDFAAPLGKPVFACAAGKVVLARKGFKLHGNTVAIDHGQGVVSIYIHLKQIKVEEGQLVASGEQIGTVGQSGRATGPHLHFGIYVNQTASNPAQWLTTVF